MGGEGRGTGLMSFREMAGDSVSLSSVVLDRREEVDEDMPQMNAKAAPKIKG